MTIPSEVNLLRISMVFYTVTPQYTVNIHVWPCHNMVRMSIPSEVNLLRISIALCTVTPPYTVNIHVWSCMTMSQHSQDVATSWSIVAVRINSPFHYNTQFVYIKISLLQFRDFNEMVLLTNTFIGFVKHICSKIGWLTMHFQRYVFLFTLSVTVPKTRKSVRRPYLA